MPVITLCMQNQLKEANLKGQVLDDSEKTITNKVAMKALGSNNPSSLGFSNRQSTSSVTIEGGKTICQNWSIYIR